MATTATRIVSVALLLGLGALAGWNFSVVPAVVALLRRRAPPALAAAAQPTA